jgi:hypothetical protein
VIDAVGSLDNGLLSEPLDGECDEIEEFDVEGDTQIGEDSLIVGEETGTCAGHVEMGVGFDIGAKVSGDPTGFDDGLLLRDDTATCVGGDEGVIGIESVSTSSVAQNTSYWVQRCMFALLLA